MTWIQTIPPEQAGGHLRQYYQGLYARYPAEYAVEVPAVRRADGSADSIVAAHSLIPEAMHHIFSAFAVLLSPDLPLTRRQQEMIATAVSAQNRCFYWVESHAEFLRQVSLDEGLAAALRRGDAEGLLDEADRAMLEYAIKLTTQPARMRAGDVDRLRAVGFDDRAILQINLIASWFNYINRVADGLGVGREP